MIKLSDLPPLPRCWTGSPISVTWSEDCEVSTREVFTDEQMRAYGLACIEATQLRTAASGVGEDKPFKLMVEHRDFVVTYCDGDTPTSMFVATGAKVTPLYLHPGAEARDADLPGAMPTDNEAITLRYGVDYIDVWNTYRDYAIAALRAREGLKDLTFETWNSKGDHYAMARENGDVKIYIGGALATISYPGTGKPEG